MAVERVAVEDGHGNRVWIRARMGFGIRERVKAETMKVELRDDGKYFVIPDMGAGDLSLLRHNILAWDGPALQEYKDVAALIDDLDPDFADTILAEINRRNRKPESPNPKSLTSNGSTNTGAVGSTHSANGAPSASILA